MSLIVHLQRISPSWEDPAIPSLRCQQLNLTAGAESSKSSHHPFTHEVRFHARLGWRSATAASTATAAATMTFLVHEAIHEATHQSSRCNLCALGTDPRPFILTRAHGRLSTSSEGGASTGLDERVRPPSSLLCSPIDASCCRHRVAAGLRTTSSALWSARGGRRRTAIAHRRRRRASATITPRAAGGRPMSPWGAGITESRRCPVSTTSCPTFRAYGVSSWPPCTCIGLLVPSPASIARGCVGITVI